MAFSSSLLLLVALLAANAAASEWVFDPGFCSWLDNLAAVLPSPASVDNQLTAARKEAVRRLSTIPDEVIKEQLCLPTGLMQSIAEYISITPCGSHDGEKTNPFPFRPWHDCLEGPVAAAQSHTVLWQRPKDVQVLHVSVPYLQREPYHVHSDLSIMFVNPHGDNGEGQQYFNEANQSVFKHLPHEPNATAPLQVQFMKPEWFHSIQNLGNLNRKRVQSPGYGAYRIMLSGTASAPVTACLPLMI